MPYVSRLSRSGLVKKSVALSPGELNYEITTLVVAYLGDDISYSRINEVVGVLECAKLELYRRVATPYEVRKCRENGDVYLPPKEKA